MSSKSKCALIVVDLQNDFLHPDGAYARGKAVNPLAQALPERVLLLAQAVKQAGGLVVARDIAHARRLCGLLEEEGDRVLRSEERRVGKEGRSRWAPYH